MKNNIHYTPDARRDMDAIWDHIAFYLQNPEAAGRMVARVMDEVEQLETFSEFGAPLSSIVNTNTDYRFLVCGNYLIFYRKRS